MAAKDTDRPQALSLDTARPCPGSTPRDRTTGPGDGVQDERGHTPSRLNHCVLLSAQVHWASKQVPMAVELSRTFHMRPCCQISPLKLLGKPGLGPVLGDECQPDSELSKLASWLVRTKLEFIPWASIPRKRTMRESRVGCAVVTHSRKRKGPAAVVQGCVHVVDVCVVLKASGTILWSMNKVQTAKAATQVGPQGSERQGQAQGGARKVPAGARPAPGPLPALRPSVELVPRTSRGQGPVWCRADAGGLGQPR